MIMKGVITPGVSAGSNQVGARETCTPQVIWPCGSASAERGTPTARPSAPSTRRSRRLMPDRSPSGLACSRSCKDELMTLLPVTLYGNALLGNVGQWAAGVSNLLRKGALIQASQKKRQSTLIAASGR